MSLIATAGAPQQVHQSSGCSSPLLGSTPPTSARESTASGGAGEDASSTAGDSVLGFSWQVVKEQFQEIAYSFENAVSEIVDLVETTRTGLENCNMALGESMVAFLEHMGLQSTEIPPGAAFGDFFEYVEEESDGTGPFVATFSMADDSDEDMDYNSDTYGDYDFDDSTLVEMVKSGADSRKLSETMQEAMAVAFARKLHAKVKPPAVDEFRQFTDNPILYDITDAMTPECATPPDSNTVLASASPDDDAACMLAAVDSARAQRCRSTAARKMGTDVVSLAAGEAVARHRRSVAAKVACVDAEGEDAAKLQQAAADARGRRRVSVAKAADVLESAGFCDGDHSQADAAKQLSVVADAMEDACRKHRKSIIKAVHQLEETAARASPSKLQPPSSELSANATPVVEAAAPDTSASGAVHSVEEQWEMLMQAKVNNALTSVFQQYNENR